MIIGNKMTTKVSTVKSSPDGPHRTARCNDEGRIEVVIAGYSNAGSAISLTNISGTVTTGGVAQNAAAANSSRTGWFIRNNSAGSLWVNTLATAVASQPSLEIKPGELYETPLNGAGTGAISIYGATTGQAWTGREW